MAGLGPTSNSQASGDAQDATPESVRWLLKYGEQVYGPYTFAAMKGYIAEGRVIAESVIAMEGAQDNADAWRTALSTDCFSSFFRSPASSSPSQPLAETSTPEAQPNAPSVTTLSDRPARQNQPISGTRPTYGSDKGQVDRRRRPETANFIIIMDLKMRSAGPLEQAIMSLGPAYKIAPNVWCVNTDATAAGLLNDLGIHISKSDRMFIIDATRDRTVWCNFGPETDAKVRRVWRRTS